MDLKSDFQSQDILRILLRLSGTNSEAKSLSLFRNRPILLQTNLIVLGHCRWQMQCVQGEKHDQKPDHLHGERTRTSGN